MLTAATFAVSLVGVSFFFCFVFSDSSRSLAFPSLFSFSPSLTMKTSPSKPKNPQNPHKAISGIFGMNLRSTLEHSVIGFWGATAAILVFCAWVFVALYAYTRKRRIL